MSAEGDTPYERAWYRLRMGYEPREMPAEQVASLPPILYEIGQLRRGERVFTCLRSGCGLFFNPGQALPVKCAMCGKGPLIVDDLDSDTKQLLRLLEQLDPEAIEQLNKQLGVDAAGAAGEAVQQPPIPPPVAMS